MIYSIQPTLQGKSWLFFKKNILLLHVQNIIINILLLCGQVFIIFLDDSLSLFLDKRILYLNQIQYLDMDNMFKNPFQGDEEDTIINLDHNAKATISFSSNPQPLLFNNNNNQPQIQEITYDNPQPISNHQSTSMFDPMNPQIQQEKPASELNEDGDLPLLQDIGIDVQLIKERMITVLTFREPNQYLIESPDLAGPVFITFVLGILLLLGEKIHFSDIEVNFLFGNIFMYFLFNYMAKIQEVSLYSIICFLGYSLLPMLLLAIIGIFIYLNNSFGVTMCLLMAGWSAKTAGDLISLLINRFTDKSLIYYPLYLFYINFALIIIF